ncbi:type II secretion system protein N [Ramlibacter rhizophilus]|uniref:type II secretion system protein N n=1 Tax=Ramlibacter rhizophilus TaxID=1781167 RepID=UPI0014325CAC|nr:type II secretion system protein N [Ramlibacter rhizophilus]
MRATTFLLWTLALFCAAYWVLRVVGTPAGAPTAPPVVRTPPPASPAAIASLLGASAAPQAAAPGAPAPSNLASRFVLTGVVADRAGRGAALIAVDGRPPRPFLVGSRIDESLVVQAVDGRQVMIGQELGGPHLVVLELPSTQK